MPAAPLHATQHFVLLLVSQKHTHLTSNLYLTDGPSLKMTAIQFFYTCFALLAYKLIYWTDRPISFSTVLLVGLCALCTSSALFGAENFLRMVANESEWQAIVHSFGSWTKTGVQTLTRLVRIYVQT